MSTQEVIRKLRSFPLASITGIVTVILLGVIYVRSMGDADREEEYNQAVKEWSRIDQNIFKNSVNLEAHLEDAKRIAQDVRQRLVRSTELAKNYQYFYRLEAATNVKITALQQKPQVAPPASKKKGDEKEKAKPLFSRVGYAMSVRGEFHEALAFLYAMEHGDHFYQLKSFSLNRPSEPENRWIGISMEFDLLGTP